MEENEELKQSALSPDKSIIDADAAALLKSTWTTVMRAIERNDHPGRDDTTDSVSHNATLKRDAL